MAEECHGVEAWQKRTRAFDRVHSVAGSLSKPDQHHTSPTKVVSMKILLEITSNVLSI